MSLAEVSIHETAVIEEGCRIGAGTRIWHHSHVRSMAVIGNECVIGKNVYVDAHAVIGHRCKIQNNVSVYDGVSLADDVFVGPSVTFTNDRVPRAFSIDWRITPTSVRRGCSIGANATIVCGVTLGEYSMVAAGATVTHDVAPHELVGGTPAKHMGWVCTCGAVVLRAPSTPASFACDNCRSAGEQ